MKTPYIFSLLLLIISCKNPIKKEIPTSSNEIIFPTFQKLLDSAQVKGSILVFDYQNDSYYSNDFEWAKTGKLPASTFKIPNSIIALETGIMEDDSTLIKWDGSPRALPIWEQDLTFKQAFHYSCVPCYQEIARKIGVERMNDFVNQFKYGDLDIDSTNIDLFWLQGNSRISAFQQIDFLKKFYQEELGISERTDRIMKRMFIVEEVNDFTLRGKSGWAIRDDGNTGWYVGYMEKGVDVYFFALLIEPTETFEMRQFSSIRKKLMMEALEEFMG